MRHMIRKTRPLILLGLASVVCLSACQSLPDPKTSPQTAAELDLARYAGRWYEQARLPHPYQDQCSSNVIADYKLQPHARLSVTNSCLKANGQRDQARAEGRLGPEKNPARLQVRFAPAWLSWWPKVWADYWVLRVDPDYQYALVGTPDRRYLWVLSRTESAEPQRVQAMLETARQQGYDLSQLSYTQQ